MNRLEAWTIIIGIALLLAALPRSFFVSLFWLAVIAVVSGALLPAVLV